MCFSCFHKLAWFHFRNLVMMIVLLLLKTSRHIHIQRKVIMLGAEIRDGELKLLKLFHSLGLIFQINIYPFPYVLNVEFILL